MDSPLAREGVHLRFLAPSLTFRLVWPSVGRFSRSQVAYAFSQQLPLREQGIKRAQVVLYRSPLLPSLYERHGRTISNPTTLWESRVAEPATDSGRATTAVAFGSLH